jgi:hypothetical protein
LIEKESGAWFESIIRTFNRMTEVPEEELDAALKSPQLSLFLFQFADYEGADIKPRNKNKVL